MELSEILSRIYPMPDSAVEKIVAAAEEIEVAKNTTVICAGKIERNIYFVKRGLLRAFVNAGARDITFWIGDEGSVAVSMESYVNRRPGYESIVALEDTVLYRVSSDRLAGLFEEDLHIANWGRKFAETEIIRAEQSLIPQLFTTAAQRYEELLRHNPWLLDRVPLEHLASYLGITPVSLSRIRGNMVKRR